MPFSKEQIEEITNNALDWYVDQLQKRYPEKSRLELLVIFHKSWEDREVKRKKRRKGHK